MREQSGRAERLRSGLSDREPVGVAEHKLHLKQTVVVGDDLGACSPLDLQHLSLQVVLRPVGHISTVGSEVVGKVNPGSCEGQNESQMREPSQAESLLLTRHEISSAFNVLWACILGSSSVARVGDLTREWRGRIVEDVLNVGSVCNAVSRLTDRVDGIRLREEITETVGLSHRGTKLLPARRVDQDITKNSSEPLELVGVLGLVESVRCRAAGEFGPPG